MLCAASILVVIFNDHNSVRSHPKTCIQVAYLRENIKVLSSGVRILVPCKFWPVIKGKDHNYTEEWWRQASISLYLTQDLSPFMYSQPLTIKQSRKKRSRLQYRCLWKNTSGFKTKGVKKSCQVKGVSSQLTLAVPGCSDEMPWEALCRVLKKQTIPLISRTSLFGLKRHSSSRWKMHVGYTDRFSLPTRQNTNHPFRKGFHEYSSKDVFSDLELVFVLLRTTILGKKLGWRIHFSGHSYLSGTLDYSHGVRTVS